MMGRPDFDDDPADLRANRAAEVANRLSDALGRLAAIDPDPVVQVCCAALDWYGVGSPWVQLFDENIRAAAADWADEAHPRELEAYVIAGLRRMNVTRLGHEARARVLVAIWNSMPEPDRRAFLARVDPKGVFRGRDASGVRR